MSKETIKMNSIRIMRIGIKAVLHTNEMSAEMNRQIIRSNWDKEGDTAARKALYKAHKALSRDRAIIRNCQEQLKATKLELRKLNRQHDIRTNAIASSMAERTTLLE